MFRVFAVLIALSLPQLTHAQTRSAGDDGDVPPSIQAVVDVFKRPLHPVLGGVAAGGGLGGGIQYTTPPEHRWFHDAKAVITVNRYWTVGGEAGFQTPKAHVGVFGEARHMSRLDFFGLGPGSQRGTHTDFRLRENAGGVRAWLRPAGPVRFGGSASIYSPDLGTGTSQDVLSIERVFASVPGLGATPRFGRFRGFVELGAPGAIAARSTDRNNDRGYQGTYQAAFETVKDLTNSYYDFHRTEFETQQKLPGFGRGHRLTLHGFAAVTNDEGVVPFYMQYALGGGGLRAFRPDLIGGDGTTDTLRGFDNYRYRDRNISLAQAEYRVPVYGPLHVSVFYDVGTVASRARHLFQNPKQDAGFGLSYRRNGVSLARIDVGFAGHEGRHILLGFGLGR